MEPENIGIGDIIKQVHDDPNKYLEFIARRTARLIIKWSVSKQKKKKPLAPEEIVTIANRVPSEELIKEISPLVIELIEEHAWRETLLLEEADATKPPEKIVIHPLMRQLISQACMQLLANELHTHHAELAQFVHDNTDLSIRILHQPERLIIFEHAIIPTNRIFHDVGDENTQLWTGHETQNKHISAKWTRHDNILVLLKRDPETKNFAITPILQGEDIRIFKDQILVFRKGIVSVYGKPDKNTLDKLPLLWEFACDIDSIENVTSFKEKTWWYLHQMTGTKKSQDNTMLEKSEMTLCLNERHPSLSYTTDSERYVINDIPFTIDTTRRQFVILAQWKIQRIAFREILEIVKLPTGGWCVDFMQRWLHMRLAFSGSTPIVSVETESGWRVYKNAVTESIPEEDPASTFSIDEWTQELVIDTWWKTKRILLGEILEAFSSQE